MKSKKHIQKEVLIGTGPIRIFLDNGQTLVFGPSAKMLGLPDGSLKFSGPKRLIGKPKGTAKQTSTIKNIVHQRRIQKNTKRKN